MRDPIALPCSGSPAAEDDPRVAAVLEAAAAPAERPVPGEDHVLQMFRQEFHEELHPGADALRRLAMGSEFTRVSTRRSMKSRTTTLVAAGAIGAFTVLGGGYAAAATGTLPESASDAARAALAAVGLAGPSEQAADQAKANFAERAAEQATSSTPPATDTTGTNTANDHGEAVSALATSTTLEGREKGEAISTLASSKSADTRQDDEADAKRDARDAAAEAGTSGETNSAKGRAKAAEKSGAERP